MERDFVVIENMNDCDKKHINFMSQFILCLEALMTSWNRDRRSKIRWDWERTIVARTDCHPSFWDLLN
jgi:hypothetical protein